MVVKNKQIDMFKVVMVLLSIVISMFTGFSSYVLANSDRYAKETREMVRTNQNELKKVSDVYVKRVEYAEDRKATQLRFYQLDTKVNQIILQ